MWHPPAAQHLARLHCAVHHAPVGLPGVMGHRHCLLELQGTRMLDVFTMSVHSLMISPVIEALAQLQANTCRLGAGGQYPITRPVFSRARGCRVYSRLPSMAHTCWSVEAASELSATPRAWASDCRPLATLATGGQADEVRTCSGDWRQMLSSAVQCAPP